MVSPSTEDKETWGGTKLLAEPTAQMTLTHAPFLVGDTPDSFLTLRSILQLRAHQQYVYMLVEI